jgi:UDP-glucose 4-epimerase
MLERNKWNVLITGATGFIGTSLIEYLIKKGIPFNHVYGTDIKPHRNPLHHDKYTFLKFDVRDEGLTKVIREHEISHIVHLASIVTPGKNSNRELEYSVDVLGTKNVLKACVENKVTQVIVTSSGAAYGYNADNSEWLTEKDPVRGNFEFPYSHHKRLVEEELAVYRSSHPELKQLILRPGTILGYTVNNQITDLFKKPMILGVQGSASPFVFIWDEDVVAIIYEGLLGEKKGIYNLASDGAVTMKEISQILKKRYVPLPPNLIRFGLKVLKKLSLTQYGPDQINFLRYRPVLDNRKLKEEFGFKLRFSSKECFMEYIKHAGLVH